MKRFLLINILFLSVSFAFAQKNDTVFWQKTNSTYKKNTIIVSGLLFDDSVFEKKRVVREQKPDTIYKNDSTFIVRMPELCHCDWRDRRARFAGGDKVLSKWLNDNFKMPKNTQKLCGSYEVFCDFSIVTNGNVTNVRISKSSNVKILDDEVVRVLELMPRCIPTSRWNSAKQDMEIINSDFTLIVTFVFKKKCKNKKINH